MAISAGPTGPFVLSLSKDRLRVFSLIEIANPRIEYGLAMTTRVRMSGSQSAPLVRLSDARCVMPRFKSASGAGAGVRAQPTLRVLSLASQAPYAAH